jgi:hypothetical protein
LFYLSQNQKNIKERFQIYLEKEFLGGFEDGLCKNHSLLWFNDVGNFKLWALQSIIYLSNEKYILNKNLCIRD